MTMEPVVNVPIAAVLFDLLVVDNDGCVCAVTAVCTAVVDVSEFACCYVHRELL